MPAFVFLKIRVEVAEGVEAAVGEVVQIGHYFGDS
jgi:hypothetical protein